MEGKQGYSLGSRQMRSTAPQAAYVKEFTRHCSDVLMNLNELRHRNILTDTTLVVGNTHLQAHSAVLVACSGFFYSLYTRHVMLQGCGSSREQLMTVSLPNNLDPSSVSLLLEFMYTSRLPLTPGVAPGVLAVAVYFQMDHVAETCQDFMLLHCRDKLSNTEPRHSSRPQTLVVQKEADHSEPSPLEPPSAAGTTSIPEEDGGCLKQGAFLTYQPKSTQLKKEPGSPLLGVRIGSPDSPARSSCHPSSPAASKTCNKSLESETKVTPDSKTWNWKKYKYIVLNPLCAATAVKVEESEEAQGGTPVQLQRTQVTPEAPTEEWPGEVPGQIDRQGRASCYEGSGRAPPLGPPTFNKEDKETAHTQPMKRERYYVPYCYSGNMPGAKTVVTGDKPYHCNVCGAQFNRPANLKTHSRIHSGEKPYRCDTCGARFVQVAHLRAHVLIHTGEKPYPCHTCGTRFRHLQTLKSHLRIHTGEKPYTCEKCDLHFRHKSQLRLHLRQKHGAITNTKVRYKVLAEPYQSLLQAC
ncbi:B-cell CLL/lymphoma 6 member B protein isoform 1-T1 [Synchiropus picturatus]